MRKTHRGWIMPEEEARSILRLIEERIRGSDIELRRRDALIRLRDMIENDLARGVPDQASSAAARTDVTA